MKLSQRYFPQVDLKVLRDDPGRCDTEERSISLGSTL